MKSCEGVAGKVGGEQGSAIGTGLTGRMKIYSAGSYFALIHNRVERATMDAHRTNVKKLGDEAVLLGRRL